MPLYNIVLKNNRALHFDTASWWIKPGSYGLLLTHRENQGQFLIPWTAIAYIWAEKPLQTLEDIANG